jgi:hypothetical protein
MARQPDDINPPDDPPRTPDGRIQRRKLGRIIHNDRHTTTMEWAPEDSNSERVVLQILEGPEADSINGFQPYGRSPGAPAAVLPYGQPAALSPEPDAPRRPKDLRKLGEWIKLTRKLEAARKGSDGKKGR